MKWKKPYSTRVVAGWGFYEAVFRRDGPFEALASLRTPASVGKVVLDCNVEGGDVGTGLSTGN